MHSVAKLYHSFLDIWPATFHVANHGVHQVRLVFFFKNFGPESSWLFEVQVCVHEFIALGQALNHVWLFHGCWILDGSSKRVWFIVGSSSSIVIDHHESVSLVVVHAIDGAVYRYLVEVHSQSVSLRVGVGEDSGLEDAVVGELDAGDEVAWAEGGLLDLREEVSWVLVENQLRNWDQWVISMRPHLRQVSHIVFVGGGVLLGHGLDVHGPGG
mmetsp:Transcript_22916/g.17377  ORF Transcript_22916/g.17377 Transcript_22916/m.17377 type:complete len:213 (-) Transcript_22916:779-1417(-)